MAYEFVDEPTSRYEFVDAPQKPVSKLDKITKGMTDSVDGGAQLLTKMLPDSVVKSGNSLNNWLADKTGMVAKLPEGGVDEAVRTKEEQYQAQRAAAGESGFDGYRTIGNIISPANLAMAAKIPAAATTAGRIGLGMLGGGASAATNPVTGGDFWTEKAKQVGTGTLFGGAVPAAMAGVSRIVSPNASKNAELLMLKKAGVKPTVGQSLGGAANTLEEKAQSLPLVGDMISSARMKAREQFNNAAINRATSEIGVKVKGSGTEAVKEAGDQISKAYEAGKAALGNFAIDQQATTELSALQKMAKQLPKKEQFQFDAAVSVLKKQLTPQGHLLPDGFKAIDSKLGADAAKFSGSSDAYQQQLGDALKEMNRIIVDNAKRANPKAAEAISKADSAWANLVRLEGAAVGAKGTDGIFTPGQLLSAVRGADKSVRDRATARGTALMQDLATAGQNVLGNKIPDSGTAGRAGLVGLGAALYANPVITGSGLLGGLTAYTPPVQNLLRAMVSSRGKSAEPIADALKKASPFLIPGGAQVGVGLLNQ